MHYHNKEKTVRDRENKGNGNHNMMDAGQIVVKEMAKRGLSGTILTITKSVTCKIYRG